MRLHRTVPFLLMGVVFIFIGCGGPGAPEDVISAKQVVLQVPGMT